MPFSITRRLDVACCLALLVSLSVILFAGCYLAHDYESLIAKYIALKNCFYRADLWPQQFFTARVKSQGNNWNCLALMIGAVSAWYSIRRLKTQTLSLQPSSYRAVPGHWPYRGLLLLSGMALWWFSHHHTRPAYDEIFSAVHCAGMHPFQTVSYYMLPNNHLLFNVLNSLLPLTPEDKVMSGRLISLLAFLATQQIAFSVLKQKMSLPAALGAVLLLSLSLPTLGFASQARGYSLQLLAGWGVVAGVWRYFDKGDRLAGRWMLLGVVAGYALLPSFLFFHIAVVLFALIMQWYSGKWNISFWKYQLLAAAFVFMFYLPALSFSGLEAFTGNKYMRADDKSLWEFAGQFFGLSDFFMNYAFSSIFTEKTYPVLYMLYLLPLSLLLSKNKKNRAIAVFYSLMWLSVVLIVLGMKKIPFSRNLIIQYSIGLGAILYTIYYWLQEWSRRWNALKATGVLLGGLLLAMSLILGMRFPKIAGEQLYFNRANELYEANSRGQATLPTDVPVAFSHESFYWYYLRLQSGGAARLCPNGDEPYLVKRSSESLPKSLMKNYELYDQPEGDGYEIWKKTK